MFVRYYYNKNETFIFIKPYFKMLFIVTFFEYSEALILCYEQSVDGRMEMTTDVAFMIKFSLLFMSLESRLEFYSRQNFVTLYIKYFISCSIVALFNSIK